MSILAKFPGKPRDVQQYALETLEQSWNDFDVFVLKLPVAAGKSRIAITLSRWLSPKARGGGSVIITPTNILLDQYLDEFTRMPTLRRRSMYHCSRWGRSCEETKRKEKGSCKGCPYVKAMRKAKASTAGVYNFYTYLAHKLYKPTLVVDEAHQLLPMLQDLAARRIWKHQFHYPEGLRSVGDVLEWLDSLPAKAGLDSRLRKLRKECESLTPATTLHFGRDRWQKKEYRDVLRLVPLTTRDEPPVLWPSGKVRKIVLMSATISDKDVEEMGLANRRVLYVDCQSPIPPANRPIRLELAGNMSMRHQPRSLPLLATKIGELMKRHPEESGVIHCTYGIAAQLRSLLSKEKLGEQHSRLLWHTKADKDTVYKRFRESKPGAVLVASGLYEGVDLPHELGRWQVVCKVPYPSLGSPGMKAKQEEDKDWYSWQALRGILQASGRICRTPEDYGVTYITDTSFMRLYGSAEHMVPDWFRHALVLDTRRSG